MSRVGNLQLIMWILLDAHSILAVVSCLYPTIVLIISEYKVLITKIAITLPFTRSPHNVYMYLFGGVCCDALDRVAHYLVPLDVVDVGEAEQRQTSL